MVDFLANWPDARMRPGVGGLGIKLQKQSFARIDLWKPGEVWILFQPCAKALCLSEFEQPVAAIPHATWPYIRDPLADTGAAIHFKLTGEAWGTHEEMLTRLARAVHEAHQAHAAR